MPYVGHLILLLKYYEVGVILMAILQMRKTRLEILSHLSEDPECWKLGMNPGCLFWAWDELLGKGCEKMEEA